MKDVSGEEMHEAYDREIMSKEIEKDNYINNEIKEQNND
jgi:hypothetical protein